MYLLLFCLEWLGLFAGTAKRAAGRSGNSQELAFFYKPMDIYFVSR
ncbi:hypothetical protein GYO_0608 [Bacillus spizizenii TU-B-10]|uniref:Uncharacterized protein n=1 Tax=Bacillus spizizenii (strain DSM 15029 / JCM 12233 / NBRC 101239 / NRRL B-23049 / TU-B-10) TaxID=1052585 RepID=G4NTV5_BACS4|nr:hypothetical protein GYO_0608 [Bacillus spizizenii TU-B-10]